MIVIPQNRKWSQTNSSDVFGSLSSTYNVNFDKEGYLQISPKSVSVYSTTDNSDFGLPLEIIPYNSGYFILTADQPFFLSTNLGLSELTDSVPTDFNLNSDAVVWRGKVYCTTNDDLVSYAPGDSPDWTQSLKTLTAGVPHPVEVMGNFSNGHLVVGNGNTVLRLDTSHNTVVTLTLNNNYQVTSLKYFNNNLFIGTKASDGGEAKVFMWNGSGTSAQSEFKTGANWVFAIEEYRAGIVGITSEGQLVQFTGGGFLPLASLPVYYTPYRWTSSVARVAKRGLKADGDILYLNIQGSVSEIDDFFYLPEQPDGIWCYDPKVGLYCRHLSTTDKLTAISVSSRSDNTLTLASATKAQTGEPIYMTENGSLTGVSDNTTYFVIRVSSTQIKLALSPANAKDGVAITLGGTAGSAAVKVNGYLNYGIRHSRGDVGGVGLITFDGTTPKLFPTIARTTIVWGFSSDGSVYHLNSLSPATNIGGFITNKIWSAEAKDSFQRLLVKYSNLNLDNEKIIVKARYKERFGLPTTAISGTFSTSSVLGSASTLLEQVEVGDNINLLSGNGAGQSVSIVSIAGDEYTLSETLANIASSDASVFNVNSFKEVGEITAQDENLKKVPTDENGIASWSQLMLELRGQNIAIEELHLINAPHEES